MRSFRKMKAAFRGVAIAAAMSLVTAPAMTAPAFAAPHKPTVIATATPIEHLVVIFQENVSFDHYFGTYPFAANSDGSTFNAAPGTPSVNGLVGGAVDEQSKRGQSGQRGERDQPVPPESQPGDDLRSESRIHRGAGSVRFWPDGCVSRDGWHRELRRFRLRAWQGTGDGLLR